MSILLVTVNVSGFTKVRPVAGQTMPDGLPVDSNKYVSCDKQFRLKASSGSVYAVDKLTLVGTGTKKPFYRCVPDPPRFVTKKGEEFSKSATKEDINLFETLVSKNVDVYNLPPVPKVDVAGFPVTSKPLEPPKPRKLPTFYERIVSNPDYKPPTIQDDGFYVDPEMWYLLLRNMLKKTSTMIFGPTGTGKTELIRLLCSRTNTPYREEDMGSMVDPQSSLLGVHRMKNRQSVFEYAKFSEFIQKPGLTVLEELSRAPRSAINILLPCMDVRRTLHVDIAEEGGRELKVHEDCVFFATANIGAEYGGTNQIDRALLDRLVMIEQGYMPMDKEADVLITRTGVDRQTAVSIMKLASQIRGMAEQDQLTTSISPRHTLEISRLVKDGFKVVTAMRHVVLPLFTGTSSTGERGTINSIITKF